MGLVMRHTGVGWAFVARIGRRRGGRGLPSMEMRRKLQRGFGRMARVRRVLNPVFDVLDMRKGQMRPRSRRHGRKQPSCHGCARQTPHDQDDDQQTMQHPAHGGMINPLARETAEHKGKHVGYATGNKLTM